MTEEFFFLKCRPLFCSIMKLVFSYEVDYDEMVNELYVYLMEDDGILLLCLSFFDRSPKIAISILLVPVAAHGVYDALAMSGQANPYIGGLSFFILIWFCTKMHKAAKSKILAMTGDGKKDFNKEA